MDPFSHYMIGFLFGRYLGLKREEMMALTFGSLVLDIDVIYYLNPDWVLPVHGSVTHTFSALLFFWLVSAALFKVWKGKLYGGLLLMGMVGHLAVDMVNTLSPFDGGKQLFYPFDKTYYSFGDFVPYAHYVWVVVAGAIFLFCLWKAWVHYQKGDAFWRVWYDERAFRKKRAEKKDNAGNEI